MTELEYFRLLAPEYAATIDATVNKWLAMADLQAAETCFTDERAAMAKALYAAHLLALSEGGSVGGCAIVSEREGDLSRTYATIKGGDTVLGSTSYGQQYIELTRPCFGVNIMTRII